MPTLYLLNLLTSQYRASLIQKYCNMAKMVVADGGISYRLSDIEEGRIEMWDSHQGKWCTHCICSNAKELLNYNGFLAYKNANGELFVESAPGWHKVVEEKRKVSKESGDYKPKKGCVHIIIWAPFKLIWWLIKQLFHLLTLGIFR